MKQLLQRKKWNYILKDVIEILASYSENTNAIFFFPFFVQTCRKTSISLVYHLTKYTTLSLQILKNVLKRPVLVMNMLHVRNFKDLSIVPVMKDLLETERIVKVRTVLYWSQMYCKTKNSNFFF